MSVSKRDSGIDLLRLFAMGLIVMHHLLLHGGLTSVFADFTPSGMGMQFLNAVTRCAVNVYALISGYVMVHSRFRPSRFIGLWLQVVFYGLLGVLCLPLMGGSIQPEQVISAAMPVSHDYYWYFTGYAAVFCLSPLLNLLLNRLSGRQSGLMLLALGGLFSVLPTLTGNDCFHLNGGYHPVWLIVLYLIGGTLRLHGFGCFANRKTALLTAAGCILLGWTVRMAAPALGAEAWKEVWLNYTSPAMLVCSICLLSLFAGRGLPAWLARAAGALSPLTFGVYLIHDHPLVREHLIHMRLVGLAGLNPAFMLGGLAAVWAGVYGICLLMEWLRTKLFALARIPALCSRAEKRLFQWADHCFPEADA